MEIIPYKIVNIIASMNIGERFHLQEVHEVLKNSEYDPEFYHALKYKNKNPKVTILVHKKGKIIFCGAKSEEEIKIAKENFFFDLKTIGYHPQNNPIHIDNLVLIGNLNKEMNLDKIAISRDGTQYEPEIFPGLFLRNVNPKFTAILFKSGKFSVTGINEKKQIPQILTIIDDFTKI